MHSDQTVCLDVKSKDVLKATKIVIMTWDDGDGFN